MSLSRKVALGAVVVLLLLFTASYLASKVLGTTIPQGGVSGAAADALARSMEEAVHVEAWQRTQAVTWRVEGRDTHLWDRQRKYLRVLHEGTTILLDLGTRQGRATRNGVELGGADLSGALAYAWAAWVNDSFWLNPVARLFDEGVTREKVALTEDPDGAAGLLVSYGAAGITPGDTHLWILDARGLPLAWRMWAAGFPVPGIRMSWTDWVTLETGARIATTHRYPGKEIRLLDVRGAETLTALVGPEDPFAALSQP